VQRPGKSRFRLFRLGLSLVKLCLALAPAACASLPDARPLLNTFHRDATVPVVLNGRERLPADVGARLLAKIQEEAGPTDILRGHLGLMERVGTSPIVCSNRATLLIDGKATFAAMLRAIREARDHINFETYIFHDDEVGRLFADMLIRKRGEGVKVNLIYDSFGCRGTPASFFDRLRKAGVRTVEFNRMHGLSSFRENSVFHRTHRKLLIVDGRVAFTGGINIGKAYLRGRRPGDHVSPPDQFWRDTDVMIEGPAVSQFQKLFLATWASQAGEAIAAAAYFPDLYERGDDLVQAVGSSQGIDHRGAYLMYVSAIAHARSSVHITQSYFAPDRQMLDVLADAARRGVDVKIILPETTDHAIIRQAGRSRYAQLLESGVKIYECQGAILHAKTAVVDGVWSTIGSTNFEYWSLASSDEVNTVVIGSRFGREMEECFAKDLARSIRITPDDWRQRPLLERAKQLFSGLIDRWL